MLKISNLTVKANNKEILKDLNLTINDGEIHVLMGPNGIGKSTICKTIFHHPDYEITKGQIIYNETDITNYDTPSIADLGFYLLNQSPIEIEGVSTAELLRSVLSKKTNTKVDIFEFNKKLTNLCTKLNIPKEFVHRDINFNMSGGEKKKMELLHLLILEPKFIILDEIDSGLDVDSIKLVGRTLKEYYDTHKPSILIITHHQDILKYFNDYRVSILQDGKIIQSGDKSLGAQIDMHGFKANIIDRDQENE